MISERLENEETENYEDGIWRDWKKLERIQVVEREGEIENGRIWWVENGWVC